MLISDWGLDVCTYDLVHGRLEQAREGNAGRAPGRKGADRAQLADLAERVPSLRRLRRGDEGLLRRRRQGVEGLNRPDRSKCRKSGGGALRKCAASFVSPRGICAVGGNLRGTDDMTLMLDKAPREDPLERGTSRPTPGRS